MDKVVAVVLRDQEVSGKMFLELSEKDLKELFPTLGQRKKVEKFLEECQLQAAAPADEDPDVQYRVNFWDQKVADQQKMIPPPAKPMKSKSKLIEKGPPEVYQLPLVQSRSGRGVIQYTIGKQPQLRVPVSAVMVVGATGAGKSTWINGMANYVLGVKLKDPFRFKLVNDGTGSQAHSKTKEIIAYTIYRQEGSPFPNTLTIIDTPGFGDTEGMKRDQILVEQVREFFSMGGVKGIDCLHAIGFVTQASMVRLTPTQKYIFDSILSIFGNDIRHNILLMTTFADNRKPAVLDAVKAADIPYTKYYKFNNSALFPEPPDAQSGNEDGDPSDALYWKLCMSNFDKFAKKLVTMQAQSLTLTREVLEERQQLETVMQSLQVQMKLWVGKIAELKQEERCMEDNEAKIAANENFTYTVKTPKTVKHDISGTGIHVTNCLNCNCTCHKHCAFANDDDKMKCSAMKDGSCTVCPKRCRWNRHVNNPWWFEVIEEIEERTYDELKQRFDEATQAKSRVQVMVANIQAKIRSTYDETMGLVVKAQQTLQRLDEIALKPNPLSQVEYIDLLIQCEKDEGKDGYLERIQYLKEVRERAKILNTVQKKGCKEAVQIALGTATRS